MKLSKFIFLFLFAFQFNLNLFAQSKTIDKIIAKVGGEIILYSDWQEQISFLKNKQSTNLDDPSCSILENLFTSMCFTLKTNTEERGLVAYCY